MNKKIVGALESLVIVAIVLVLVQTFLEDLAVVAGWSWTLRRGLIISGFFFDLFFTVEFLSRLALSLGRGEARRYLIKRRGWIDFLASVPLLAFNSGPTLLAVLAGSGSMLAAAGILNVLKVVKAVRIARILRLLRILKIVKQIKNTDSIMAQRHLAKIATMTVAAIVFALLAAAFLKPLLGIPGADTILERENQKTAQGIAAQDPGRGPEAWREEARGDESLLLVKREGRTLYSRYDNAVYSTSYGFQDYSVITQGAYTFFFDRKPVQIEQSWGNLLYFVLIVLVVLTLLLLYSPHFAMTISDPIHVMRRGMVEPDYHFQVKIQEEYSEDDIFRLARHYNDTFLPMKDREKQSREPETTALDLNMGDIENLLQ